MGKRVRPVAKEAGAVGFDPRGKSFEVRLDRFLADARNRHKSMLRIDEGRTVEWQQKHHVAHMFVYNKYKSTKPANTAKGKRTIAWSHLSDPKVKWELVDWKDLLRTASNKTPVMEDGEWKPGQEPDEAATIERAKALQKAAGIGGGGTAMVSSGSQPCGEPCKCKAGRSNHLEGKAADLNTRDLKSLENKLKSAKAGSLDDYLAEFGLYRPLLRHPSSPESWHVEALPDAKLNSPQGGPPDAM